MPNKKPPPAVSVSIAEAPLDKPQAADGDDQQAKR
jgi:hypothetical protein